MEARRRKASALWLRIFPVPVETSSAVEPSDCALDDPTLGQNDKAFDLITTPDDFGYQVRHGERETIVKHRPGVGGVGKPS